MQTKFDVRGEMVERLIAELTSMFFMKDFVFRSPSYLTGGDKRQITDLMFLLNRDCIFVSVKGTDGNEKTTDRLSHWQTKRPGKPARMQRLHARERLKWKYPR
jgi:hypothetical protein